MGNVSCGCARWEMLHVNYEEKAQFRPKYIRADGRCEWPLFLTKAPLRLKPNEVKKKCCYSLFLFSVYWSMHGINSAMV